MPFEGKNILKVSENIMNGSKYLQTIDNDLFPPVYSDELKNLTYDLLKSDYKNRPTIDQILAPILKVKYP